MPSPGGPARASTSVVVADSSQVGEVRRTVAGACRVVGLDETETGRASIVATEAATNILKHAGQGEILVGPLAPDDVGIEMLVLDRGRGIANLDAALHDGHSTAGSRGTGFGAMRRQSSVFDVYSQPGRGTVIVSRIVAEPSRGTPLEVSALSVPKPGEEECGDVWSVERRAGGVRIVLADGLGHGASAREAAVTAVLAVHGRPPGPSRLLEDVHAASRSTRGAAVAVAEVDLEAGEVRFAGVGNVAGVLLGAGRTENMVSMNGTAGQGTLKVREFTYRFMRGTTLVMCSDGLASHWALDEYPGLATRHPGLIAGALYRDHSRRRDDVTVVAARLGSPG